MKSYSNAVRKNNIRKFLFEVTLDSDLKLICENSAELVYDKLVAETNLNDVLSDVDDSMGTHLCITFVRREDMLKFHEDLQPKLSEFGILRAFPLVHESVFVTFKHVHPSIPDAKFRRVLSEMCCNPSSTSVKLNKHRHRTYTRFAEFPTEEFFKNPLPSLFVLGRDEVVVWYRGIVETCYACGEEGHKRSDCPLKQKKEDGGNSESVKYKNTAFINLSNQSNDVSSKSSDASQSVAKTDVQQAGNHHENSEATNATKTDAPSISSTPLKRKKPKQRSAVTPVSARENNSLGNNNTTNVSHSDSMWYTYDTESESDDFPPLASADPTVKFKRKTRGSGGSDVVPDSKK